MAETECPKGHLRAGLAKSWLTVCRSYLCLGIVAALAVCATRAEAQTGVFLVDPANGCRVWTNSSKPEELTAQWHGACRGGFASGRGTYTQQRLGKVVINGEGEFVAGKMQGRGVVVYDGARTEGEFRDGLLNGRGLRVYSDGARTEGEFRDGLLNGRGIQTFSSGERYDGEYAAGLNNGHGVYTWPDGARFEGEWKEGSIDGPGLYQTASGKVVKANWRGTCAVNGEAYFLMNGSETFGCSSRRDSKKR